MTIIVMRRAAALPGFRRTCVGKPVIAVIPCYIGSSRGWRKAFASPQIIRITQYSTWSCRNRFVAHQAFFDGRVSAGLVVLRALVRRCRAQ